MRRSATSRAPRASWSRPSTPYGERSRSESSSPRATPPTPRGSATSRSATKIGDVQSAQGQLEQALNAYRRALAIAEQLAARDPSNAAWQRDLSVSYEKIGDVQSAQGQLEPALDAYRRALAIREQLAARDPSNAAWQRDLGVSYLRVSQALPEDRQPEAAELMQRGLTVLVELAQAGRLPLPDVARLEQLLEGLGEREDGS